MTDLDMKDVAAETNVIPNEDNLGKLVDLVEKQIMLEDWIAKAEARVATEKERLKRMSEVLIPEAMHTLGVKTLTLRSGAEVQIKPWYSMKIPEGNELDGYKWINDFGSGDIIKHSMTVDVRMTNDHLLEKVRAQAMAMNLGISEKISIHHMTASSWVKEQISNGKVIPRDLLGVNNGYKTKIVRGLERKQIW